VTGVGTAGTGANIVTEATSSTAGINVSTAGAVAVTFTQASTVTAGTAGAVVLNMAGTGAVAYTGLASHASQTINLSNTGTVTVQAGSTATAYAINASGTTTAKTYVNSSTTLSVDTYVGTSAVDTVTLGLGADVFTTGGGADVFNIAPTTGTGLALGFAFGAAVPANGSVLSTAGLDKIIGFGTTVGATIVTGLTETGVYARNGQTMGAGTNTATDRDFALVSGVYDATNQTFTVALSGADTMFVYDDNGDNTGGNLRGIVLVGYLDAAGNDTYTGTFTGVGG